MQILFLILMFVLGAVFGSFLCCQVRRLEAGRSFEGHPQSLRGRSDERPEKERQLPPRSICLHCKKQLKWYDNIPIVSWLLLGGKCRYCHKKIGYAEIIYELGLAIAFLSLGTYFLALNGSITPDFLANFPTIEPMKWVIFITTLVLILSLAFLAIYDGLYGELPIVALVISAAIAIVMAILEAWPEFTAMPIASAALFGGIYLILYLISKGKWVGDGDWILAGIIGLALGHPLLSVIALFIANLSACIIMFPTVKDKKNHQVYFGPFLVLAFIITYVFSDFFISVI